jgi:hypothetical protein
MDKPTRPPDRLNEQFAVTSAAFVQEPGEPARLKEPEKPGGPAKLKKPGELAKLKKPRRLAGLKEPQGMRRAREGGTAAEADTVRVRREAERFAEDAKMDPSNCLMEILTLKQNQEGIRIRESPGDCVERLPWVLKRVFPRTLCRPVNDEQGGCASSKVRGSDGRCASSGVRQSGDPGGGPEPEAKYKPACGKPLGVLDEIQTVDRATGAQMPGSAVMGAQEVPGGQMIVATVASVRDQIQETARLFDPHGSPLITLEGEENGSVSKDVRKQSAAQQVPARLSSFQPGLRCEATCTERPKEPASGKVSGTPTTKTHESISLGDRELSIDKEEAMRNSR